MLLLKLIYTLLLFTLFSQSSAAQDTTKEEEITNIKNYDQLIRKIYDDINTYTGKGIENSINMLYKDNMFLLLMQSYKDDDNKTIANNDSALKSNLNNNITKEKIIEKTFTLLNLYDNENLIYSYERPVIKGLIKHQNDLKTPISNNGAITKAVNISSERLLDLRKEVTTFLAGFVIFAIVFHFAFGMLVRLKSAGKKRSKNSMFVFIEIMIYIILVIILSLLISNKCRDYRISTIRFLSDTYKGALRYQYELSEDDYIVNVGNTDSTTAVYKTISDNDFRAMIKNMEYKKFHVSRFGYAINYPDILTEISVPFNSDGCTMKDKWGMITLTTFGGYNILEYDIDSFANIKDDLDKDLRLTSFNIDHKNNFYVKEGYLKQDMMLYQKGAIIISYDLETLVFAELRYPKKFKKEFKPIIRKIFNDFPIKQEFVPE